MHEGNKLVLAVSEAVLGRVSSCDVQVSHPLVSRRHCCLHATAGGVFVEDLGSSNGTYVNGGLASGRVRMSVGDEFRIGKEGPSFQLLSAVVNGADVATLDAESMEKTMMAGDPRIGELAAQVRVAPDAAPSAPPLDDDEAPTRAVGATQATDAIPVAVPMEPSEDSLVADRGARARPQAEDEAPTEATGTLVVVHPPGQPASPSQARAEEEAPTTETILPPPTRGFFPGFVVGLLLGVVIAAAAAVFTPWGDTLAGWPDDAPADAEDGR